MKTIGTIVRTYGFEGAVVVRSDSGVIKEPLKGEPVFIVIDGIPVPFFTREAYVPSPDTLVISFDDYLTEESVMSFKSCKVMTTGEDKQSEDVDLKGYTVKDDLSVFTGIITSLITNPGQILAEVKSENGIVLIPLHADLILKIDRIRRVIVMSLPTGLTGVNG